MGNLTSYIDPLAVPLCCVTGVPSRSLLGVTQIDVRFATIAEMKQRRFPWLGMRRMSNTAHFNLSVFLPIHNIVRKGMAKKL